MSKILVVNGTSYASAIDNLGDIVYSPEQLVTNGADFKLVLFTGGADVSPSYYDDESPKNLCWCDENRDKMEAEILAIARTLDIRCIGICRGVQFLNVMAGGKMWHDVSHHTHADHDMTTHDGSIVRVTSLHHQMIYPTKDAHVIGWSTKSLSHHYVGKNDEMMVGPAREPEAALFPGLESAGVQYHPEYMDKGSDGWKWFNQLAKDLIEIKDFSDIVKKYTEDSCNNWNIQSAPS